MLTPHGWFEQIDADNDKWQWHGDWELADAGFPILGYDVNHDGKLDLIYGQGHAYGLYWLEQAGTPTYPKWIRHTIDESFSQSHALALVDVDGDGVPELITGKRYRGHSGGDPGSYDPVVVYAYKLPAKAQFTAAKAHSAGKENVSAQSSAGTTNGSRTMQIGDSASDVAFTRIEISVNGTASAGTQFLAADFDHDGDIDLASAGKLGVHVFENLKVNKVPKSVREETQPLNRKWPFPGGRGRGSTGRRSDTARVIVACHFSFCGAIDLESGFCGLGRFSFGESFVRRHLGSVPCRPQCFCFTAGLTTVATKVKRLSRPLLTANTSLHEWAVAANCAPLRY